MRSPVNKALFDSIGFHLARLDDGAIARIVDNKKSVYDAIENAMGDHNVRLRDAISRDAQSKASVKRRFEFFGNLFLNPEGS